jgi:hypothetical protein
MQRLLVGNAHEARRIAARCAVEAVRPAGRHGEEGRRFDEGAVIGVDVVDLLHERATERLVVKRFELIERRNEVGVRAVACHVPCSSQSAFRRKFLETNLQRFALSRQPEGGRTQGTFQLSGSAPKRRHSLG